MCTLDFQLKCNIARLIKLVYAPEHYRHYCTHACGNGDGYKEADTLEMRSCYSTNSGLTEESLLGVN